MYPDPGGPKTYGSDRSGFRHWIAIIYTCFLFRVHDRVMCEATYNATMPFKWNATKVQVLPGGGGGAGLMASQVSYLT
jgi:hypothetical protein